MSENDIAAALVVEDLNTRFIGRNILYYPTVASTMDLARKAAKEGAFEGTAVVADEQTAGRGRLQRPWLSPKGSIALSIILRPDLAQLPRLTMAASLAAVRAIKKVTGLKADIKWPNDVLIGGRKVCGILVESELRGRAINWAIVGLGMNVNLDLTPFPEVANLATSLSAELGSEVSRLEVLRSLLVELEFYYLALRRGEPIHEEWRRCLETLGKEVQVMSSEVMEEGRAESVDSDGCLLLRRSDGSLVKIVAGDVMLHR